MKAGFSTIGCPDLYFDDVISLSKEYGFSNIEIRALENKMYLPDVKDFGEDRLKDTLLKLRKARISVACLTSRCCLENGRQYLDEAKNYVILAEKLKIPFVRVLGDAMPEPGTADTDLVFGLLCALDEFAKDYSVMPLIETNGVYANSLFLKQIFTEGNFKHIGVLWDIHHPYVYYKESPEYTYSNLSEYIKYMHIKDSVVKNGRVTYVPVGEGTVPVKECIKLCRSGGFKGPYTLEWVKVTHPELENIENVLLEYKNYINTIK